MSNVLRDQCTFFTIPNEFVVAGGSKNCSSSAIRLYTALLYLAQRHSAVRLELSNGQLQELTGLDTKSIASARTRLVELRLIQTTKGGMGILTYGLLNPATHRPLPPPYGKKGFRPYRSAGTANQNPPTANAKGKGSEDPPGQNTNFVASAGKEFALPPPAKEAVPCFSCKGTDFWLRGDSRVCSRCHPNPKEASSRLKVCSPTAKELGFG